MFNPENLYKRDQDVISAESLDEVLVLRPTTGQYYGLGETGSLVWSLLSSPGTVPEIAAKVAAAYRIPSEITEADITAFMQDLAKEQLIRPEAAAPNREPIALALPLPSHSPATYSAPTLAVASLREAANGNSGYLDGGYTTSGGPGGLSSSS